MLRKPSGKSRSGAASLEAAIVLPASFVLTLGLIIGGLAIFRFQQVCHFAREAARFASVHGGQYAQENATAIAAGTLPKVDKAYLVNYIKSRAAGLDTSQITVTVTMTVMKPGATSAGSTESVDWDNTTENQSRSPYSSWTDSSTTPSTKVKVYNVVIVQIDYAWMPELYVVGPITLTSKSVLPMSF